MSVSSDAQLVSALSDAQPGDHIVLANGTYSGTFTTGANGTSDVPIVIEAANQSGATFSGKLRLTQAFNTVYGCRFTGSGNTVEITAPDCRVLRCVFQLPSTTSGSAIDATPAAARLEAAYNFTTGGYFPFRLQPAVASSNPAPLDSWIHHNHWKNSGANACEIGSEWATSATNTGMLLEYNLVENCGKNTSLGCKASNITYFRNTILNCGPKRLFQARHGRNCRFIANALINSAGIMVRGDGHLVIGNYREGIANGSWTEHTVPTGKIRIEDFIIGNFDTSQIMHPTGDRCTFIGNLPRTRIGGGSSVDPLLPTGNRVESAGSNWLLVSGRHIDTTTSTSVSRSVPPYVILKSSDVGPLAD